MSLAYREAVLAKNPVAYWRLGESTGTVAADETGNGHDGTYVGNPVLGQPGAISDDPNSAVQFTGASYVEIPTSPDFSQPTSGNGLTVEAWMRPDTLSFPGQQPTNSNENPYVHWLGKGEVQKFNGETRQFEWGLRFYSSEPSQEPAARPNRISGYIWNPVGKEGAGAYFQRALTAGQWLHIVVCYEPGDKNTCPPAGVQIYLNGVQKGTHDVGTLYCNPCFAIVPAAGQAPLRLGTRDAVSFLIGALDEVAIYPRVLSPAEVLSNFNAALS